MDKSALAKNLCRFGGTPYEVASFTAEIDEGLMLPLSKLNDLRRRAVEAFQAIGQPAYEERPYEPRGANGIRAAQNIASFRSEEQITPAAIRFFEKRFLPLFNYSEKANGVLLPPVIFDSDFDSVRKALKAAKEKGALYALLGNFGHLSLVEEAGLIPIGDFRFNLYNKESVRLLETLGVNEMILSPELSLPQARDVGGNSFALVYGRIPLMVLEKCIIRELANCRSCAEDAVVLTDRRNVSFPVLREYDHRNVIYNSLPTSMSDKQSDLERARLSARYFLFSIETPDEVDEVIEAFQKERPLPYPVRRIGS